MTIDGISPQIEKPFRKALGHAIRNELEEMRSTLLNLTDEQIVTCVGLCALVSGYVAIDACGRQWPDEDNLRRIAEAATTGSYARQFGLKFRDSYDYVKRVALRSEQIDKVFPSPENAATLSFVITGHLLGAFRPADQDWWEYLNRIEEAVEAAAGADLGLLPALMLRSRRFSSSGTSDGVGR